MSNPIVINPAEVIALDNQTRLNNGCVCPHGCDSCARLAEAWEAMREALQECVDRWPQSVPASARAALALAREVQK